MSRCHDFDFALGLVIDRLVMVDSVIGLEWVWSYVGVG